MNKRSKLVLGTVVVVGALFCAVFAFAAGGHGKWHGKGHGMHNGDGFGHVYGEITAIDGDTYTITPSIPEFFKEKMDEHGIHVDIDLPASATVTVTSDTKFLINGAEGAFDDFGVGDIIMAVGKDDGSFNITARRVADPSTVQDHIEGMHDKMRERHGKGHDGHPFFGEITAMDDAGVTIKPEIPDFIKDKFAEHSGRMKARVELPESVTLAWGEGVHFMVAGERVDENPFKVGDKVGMMVQGKVKDGTGIVIGMGDIETVRMHVEGMEGHSRGMHGCDGHGGHH